MSAKFPWKYGWLSEPFPSGGTAVVYDYGWPAGGTEEPDVALQFIFDEASGNIVDEVAGVELTVTGSPTYNVTLSGSYADISPGIYCFNAPFFGKAGTTAEGAPGTSDFTFEFWYDLGTSTSGGNYVWGAWDADASNAGIAIFFTADDNLSARLEATDGTTIQPIWVFDASTCTTTTLGAPNKIRITFDRSGNAECFLNGASLGTASIAALDGKTLVCEDLSIFGHSATTVAARHLTLYEARLSFNLTNNSGGPNNG